MEKIIFTVPAVPVAQPRQRHRVFKGKDGKVFSSNYTPTKDPVNAFKAAAKVAAAQAHDGAPLKGPLRVSLIFIMPRGNKPSWLTKKEYPEIFAAWKCGDRVPHATSRNDRDNLMKSIQDALNELLWKDDGMIFAGPVEKWIASDREQPCVEIMVEEVKSC